MSLTSVLRSLGSANLGYLGRFNLLGASTQIRWKANDRRELIESTPKKDQGTLGEAGVDIDLITRNKSDMFPDEDTPNRLFDGVRFSDLPICHIKSTKNNTLIRVNTAKGEQLAWKTCGMEGFKNARKGTNIAAQATAISVTQQLKEKGIKNLRVKIQGIGPGRVSSVKGLQMGGITVISLTDCTRISWHPPRPRKARRL